MTTRVLFLLLIIAFPFSISAQLVVDVDKFDGSALTFFKTVGGEPLSNTKFIKIVEGSAYFSDQWMKGNVWIEESEYRNILLRINILETSLEFMDTRGEAMVCTQPIKRVILIDSLGGAQYNFINASFLPGAEEIKNSWLMQLASGQAALYKLAKKQINETRPYGSATTEQHIITFYTYFLYYNNQLLRIKKTSDIPDLLISKKPELQDYIKSNHLSAKDEKDMISLVKYYNTL